MFMLKMIGIIALVLVLGALMADVVTSLGTTVDDDASANLLFQLKGLLWLLFLGIIGIGAVLFFLRGGRGAGQ